MHLVGTRIQVTDPAGIVLPLTIAERICGANGELSHYVAVDPDGTRIDVKHDDIAVVTARVVEVPSVSQPSPTPPGPRPTRGRGSPAK